MWLDGRKQHFAAVLTNRPLGPPIVNVTDSDTCIASFVRCFAPDPLSSSLVAVIVVARSSYQGLRAFFAPRRLFTMASAARISTDASVGAPNSDPSAASSSARTLETKAAPVADYLKQLSAAQYAAVTHPAKAALSISAPPGSGKTRVLTSRVAWLVREQKIMPEEMVVVTFTNKAANEMRHRLTGLIGSDRTSRLVMGTFHAICARYLRKYGALINIENNFSIMDADDSKKVIKEILGGLKEHMEAENLKIKPEQAQGTISWSKAKDVSPKEYRASVHKRGGKGFRNALEDASSYKATIATVYEMYEDRLRQANALDFDDLLVMGARLLKQHPHVVSNVRHTLVDEMQDTNTTQYQLMSLFAHATKCVTTVGDPDQAVYGWRAAEVGNLDRMKREFSCEQALLEENYRSTGQILKSALAVIEQDKSRVAKGLFTAHPDGPPVTLKELRSAQSEASFIATEIKRLMAYSAGLLNFNDVSSGRFCCMRGDSANITLYFVRSLPSCCATMLSVERSSRRFRLRTFLAVW